MLYAYIDIKIKILAFSPELRAFTDAVTQMPSDSLLYAAELQIWAQIKAEISWQSFNTQNTRYPLEVRIVKLFQF